MTDDNNLLQQPLAIITVMLDGDRISADLGGLSPIVATAVLAAVQDVLEGMVPTVEVTGPGGQVFSATVSLADDDEDDE
jgi:FlaG/FlaF family flagellin (archaellin)